MFDLHSITLSNFRSYLGQHEFEFPTDTGLYFFTGKNDVALGSNGAGKSTLLDAIVWALYGRTTRGLKANEVISWGAANCAVTLELTVGDEKLQIQRTQKPNGLFLGDKPVDQKELEKHIRLNYESFTYSVINPQFGESFLALAPSAKLTLFSDIMGLEYWLEKSEEAAKLTKEHENGLMGLRAVISRYEGQLATVNDDIECFTKQAAAFEDERKLQIHIKKKDIASVKNKAISMDEKIKQIASESTKRLAELEAKSDLQIDNITRTARERAAYATTLAALKQQREECKGLGAECPTCHQKVDPDYLTAQVTEISLKERFVERQIQGADDDLEIFKKGLVKTKSKIGAVTDTINETREAKSEARLLHDKALRLERELIDLKAAADPYENLLMHKGYQQRQFTQTINANKNAEKNLEALHAASTFWIKGFKRIRLFIIEQAFRTLEIEVNNSLSQLGMNNWQITFDVERENKSGGVTKGFVVFVHSPANDEPVKWESWSGGETQRLQLAGDLGLANLIMQQAGLSNTVEFFDEPSTHLSPEGMMDLANMLHERAVSEGKRVWIVDHTSITNFGEFIGIITARKSNNGSTISYSNSV